MNEPQRLRDLEPEGHDITGSIIGAAIEVHRVLGPGLVEPIYERALCIELDDRDVRYVRRTPTKTERASSNALFW
jgi:GxxExxY protein